MALNIFYSHAWADKAAILPIKADLDAAGFTGWIDEVELRGGGSLFAQIADGIGRADVIVVFLSSTYVSRENCRKELSLSVDFGKKILPVLLDGISWPIQSSDGPWAGEIAVRLTGKLYVKASSALIIEALVAMGIQPSGGVKLSSTLHDIGNSAKAGSDAAGTSSGDNPGGDAAPCPGIPYSPEDSKADCQLHDSGTDASGGGGSAPSFSSAAAASSHANAQPLADGRSFTRTSTAIAWAQLAPDDTEPLPGGMGVVFKATLARSRHARETVAVKVLNAARLRAKECAAATDELEREGEILTTAADHGLNQYVVPQFGIVRGTPSDEWCARLVEFVKPCIEGVVGIVMKWVDCGTLYSRIHSGRVPWALKTSERLLLLERISRGVAALHDLRPQQIIHGDIKSENVLLKATGEPLLSDFGISRTRKVVADTAAGLTLATSSAGRQAGTWAYMAPEMMKTIAAAARPASTSTDAYALGTLAWEVLSGDIPWDGFDAVSRMLELHRGGALDWTRLPRDAPVVVREVLERATGAALPRPSALQLAEVFAAARVELESGQYDVFLSHVWFGTAHAPITTLVYTALHDGMRLRVWLDKHDMTRDMDRSMDAGVEASSCVVALVSSEYPARENCMRELRAAARYGKKVVVGIVHPPVPQAADEKPWWPSRSAASALERELADIIGCRVVSDASGGGGRAGNLFADLRCFHEPGPPITDALASVQERRTEQMRLLMQQVHDALRPSSAGSLVAPVLSGTASSARLLGGPAISAAADRVASEKHVASSSAGASSGFAAAEQSLLSRGGRGYFVLKLFSAPRLSWDVCEVHASSSWFSASSTVNHRAGETKIICFSLNGGDNQTFLLESVDGDANAVTITPRCCEGKLFVGEIGDVVCLVPAAVVWRIDSIPGMTSLVRFSLGARTIQADEAVRRPLLLVNSGMGSSERQTFRAEAPADVRLRSPPPLAPSPSALTLADGAYYVCSFKDSKSWDIPAQFHIHDHRKVAVAVIMWPFHGRKNQQYFVESALGGVTIAPMCCRGTYFLGVKGRAVHFVDRPFVWRLINVEGVKGRFRLADGNGQNVESEWPWATLLPSLVVNAPSSTRRQIFEFTPILAPASPAPSSTPRGGASSSGGT